MSDLLSGFIGSAIGAFATWIAVAKAHRHNLALKEWEVECQIRGVIAAVAIEMRICYKAYCEGIGAQLERTANDQPLQTRLALSGEYTLAYRNNIQLIGAIGNEPLRELIIETHTQWMLLFNLYHINNLLIDGVRDSTVRALETNRAEYHALAKKYAEGAVELTPRIKQLHQHCKKLTERMLSSIAQHERDNPLKKPTMESIFDDE